MPTGDALSSADRAFVPPEKLRDYALCPDHPVGRNKARVFLSALGISADNWEHLRDQIQAGVVTAAITNIKTKPHGVC